MNVKEYEFIADLFQILSHPIRLQILDALRKGSCCVCHLQVLTSRTQVYISQQLRVLREAELVIDEKDGQNVYYQLSNENIRSLLDEVIGEAESPAKLPGCTCPKCLVDQP